MKRFFNIHPFFTRSLGVIVLFLAAHANADAQTYSFSNGALSIEVVVQNECDGSEDASITFNVLSAATAQVRLIQIIGPTDANDKYSAFNQNISVPGSFTFRGWDFLTSPPNGVPLATAQLVDGMYDFRIREFGGTNEIINSVEIFDYPPITEDPATIVTDKTTCTSDDGVIEVYVNGGSGTFTYSWADDPGDTDGYRDNLGVGTYELTVTDDLSSCVFVKEYEILDPLPLPFDVYTPDAQVCEGDDITVTAGVMDLPTAGDYAGEAGVEYFLKLGNNASADLLGPELGDGTNPIEFTINADDYTSEQNIIVVARLATCQDRFGTNTVSVELIPPPDAGADATVDACNDDDSFDLFDALGGTPDAGGAWAQTSGTSTITITTNSADFDGATVGTYTFEYTVDGTTPCPDDVAVLTVELHQSATAEAGNPQAICSEGVATLSGSSIGGSATVGTWTIFSQPGTDGQLGFMGATDQPDTVTFTGVTAGAYVLRLTTDNPATVCNAVSDVVTITIEPAAEVEAGGNQDLCSGDELTLTGSSVDGAATEGTWTIETQPMGGDGQLGFAGATNPTDTVTFTATVPGAYALRLTTNDPAGQCDEVFDEVTITVFEAPTVEAGANQPICSEGEATLTGSSIGGSATVGTWTIFSQPGSDGQLGFTGATDQPDTVMFTGVTAGNYILRLTTNDPATICDAVSDVVTITIQPAAEVEAGGNQDLCSGDALSLTGSSIGGAATVGTWTIESQPMGGDGQLGFAGATNLTDTVSFTATVPGAYTLRLTTDDPAGQCDEVFDEVTITVFEAPTVEAGGNQAICSEGVATLSGSSIGGSATEATWTIFSQPGTDGQLGFTGATDQPDTVTFTGVTAGAYVLHLTTDAPSLACGSVTDAVTITIQLAAEVEAGGNQDLCSGDELTLTGSSVDGAATEGTWTIETQPMGGDGQLGFAGATNPTDTVTFTATVPGAYTLRLTTNDPAGQCDEVFDEVTITVFEAPTVEAGANQPICSEGEATLTGSSIGGSATVGTWTIFSQPGSDGQLGFTGATDQPDTVTFTGVTAGNYVLRLTTNDPATICDAVSDVVTITIQPAAEVEAGGNQDLCSGDALSLTGSSIGGAATVGTWTIESQPMGGDGQLGFAGATNLTDTVSFTATVPGAYTLRLTTDDPAGQCDEVFDEVTITVFEAPTVEAGGNQAICSENEATLGGAGIGGSATEATWTIFSQPGTDGQLGFTGATDQPDTVTFTGVTAGAYVLHLTTDAPSLACGSVTDVVTITIEEAAIAIAGPNQGLCIGEEITLTNSSVDGSATVGTWTIETQPMGGDGQLGFTGATNPTDTVTFVATVAGTYTLRLTTDSPGGQCTAEYDEMTVTVASEAEAEAGAPQDLCSGDALSLTGSSVGGSASEGTWTIESQPTGGDGQLGFAGATNLTDTVSFTATAPGAYTLRLTTNDPIGSCDAEFDEVTITVFEAPTVEAGGNQAICSEGEATLSGSSIGGSATEATWTIFSQPGTDGQLGFTGATDQPDTVTFTGVTAGAYVLHLTTDAPSLACGSVTDVVTITVEEAAIAIAGPNQGLCIGEEITLTNSSVDGSATVGMWTIESQPTGGDGQLGFTGATNPTDTVTFVATVAGTYTLRLTTDSPGGQCTIEYDEMTVTVASEAEVEAGAAQNLCSGNEISLTGSSVGGSASEGTWTIESQPAGGDGQLGFTGATNPTDTVTFTASVLGDYVLRLTTDDPSGSCDSEFDEVTISVVTPATAEAGPIQSICPAEVTILTGSSIGGAASDGTWTIETQPTGGDGQLGFTSATNPTDTVTFSATVPGIYRLRLTTNNPTGNCEAVFDEVDITVEPLPVPSITGDLTVCEEDTETYTTDAGQSNYNWTVTGGSIVSGGDGFDNIEIEWDGNAPYNVSVSYQDGNGCTGTSDEDVTVNPLPTATITASDTDLCAGQNTNLTVTFTGTPNWTYQLFNGTTTTAPVATPTGVVLVVNPADTTIYNIVNLTDGNGCVSPTTGADTVNVAQPANPNLTITTGIGSGTLCTGGSTTVTITAAQAGVTYVLRNDSNNNFISFGVGTGANLSLQTGALMDTITFNILADAPGCTPVQMTTKPTVNVAGNINASLQVNATDSELCEGESTVITVVNSQNGVLYRLRNDATNANISGQVPGNGGNLVFNVTPAATITYNVAATNGTCSIVLNNRPTVTVYTEPDAALTVNGPGANICSGGTASIDIVASETGVSYQLRDDSNDAVSGVAVIGTGGTITLESDQLTTSTTFNILATHGACTPVELTTLVPVTVGGTIDATVTAVPLDAAICEGAGTTIRIASPEAGVTYTLRLDADNSAVGVGQTGAGPLDFPTGSLSDTTVFNILADIGTCQLQLTNLVTVDVVTTPDASLDLSASVEPVCSGGASAIQVSNSEVGVSYQLLLEPAETAVGMPVIGTGGTISLATDPITVDTDFSVRATSTVCGTVDLTEVVTITVGVGTIDNSLTVGTTDGELCYGEATFIQVFNAELGVTYQLRNDANDNNIGVAVTATVAGETLFFPTGNLTASTTYNILAGDGSCSIELTDKESITVNDPPNADITVTPTELTTCPGATITITVALAEQDVLYELRNDTDNSIIDSGTGDGTDLQLSTGTLNTSRTFNILATNTVTLCSIELTQLVTITLNSGADIARSVTATPALICAGASSMIVVNSQPNILYQLRLNSDNSLVGGQYLGTGFSLGLPTMALTDTTEFNVFATALDGTCGRQLSTVVTVTTRALNDPLCGSGGGNPGLGNEDCSLFSGGVSGITLPYGIPASCSGADDGQIIFNITGGNTATSYTVIVIDSVRNISTSGNGLASTNIIIDDLAPAQYWYRIIDGNGDYCTLPFTVEREAALTASADQFEGQICQGSNDGKARITITSAGSSTYEYSIAGDFTDAKPFVSGGDKITDLPRGQYNIVVRDVARPQCTATVSVDIAQSLIPVVTEISPASKTDATCASNDGTITVSLDLTGGSSYTFKFGVAGGILDDVAQFPVDGVFRNLAPNATGEHYQLVVDGNMGCSPDTFDLPNITFPGIVSYSNPIITEPTCTGDGKDGRIRFDIANNNAVGVYEYAIRTISSASPPPADTDYHPASFNPVTVSDTLRAMTYYIWIRSTGGTCPTIVTVDVEGAVPVNFTANHSDEQCYGNGGSILLTDIEGVDGVDFEYQIKRNGQIDSVDTFTFNESFGTITVAGLDQGDFEILVSQPGTTLDCLVPAKTLTILGPSSPLLAADRFVEPEDGISIPNIPTGSVRVAVTGGGAFPNQGLDYYYTWIADSSIRSLNVRDTVELMVGREADFRGLPPGDYAAGALDYWGCVTYSFFKIGDDNSVFIPNLFTPNEDAFNDVFEILNLDKIPGAVAKIKITNRWGNEVFTSNDYYNNWWDAEGAVDGVYFYVLNYNGKDYSGWVEVLRGSKP